MSLLKLKLLGSACRLLKTASRTPRHLSPSSVMIWRFRYPTANLATSHTSSRLDVASNLFMLGRNSNLLARSACTQSPLLPTS